MMLKRKIILRTMIAIGIIFLFSFSDYGFYTFLKLKYENTKTSNEIETQRILTDSLQKIKRKLLFDSLLIQKIAREHYGFIIKNEEVFILTEP